jgi:hypothetical protein
VRGEARIERPFKADHPASSTFFTDVFQKLSCAGRFLPRISQIIKPPFLSVLSVKSVVTFLLVPGRCPPPAAPLQAGLTTLPDEGIDAAYPLCYPTGPNRKKALLPNEAKLFTPKMACNKLSFNNMQISQFGLAFPNKGVQPHVLKPRIAPKWHFLASYEHQQTTTCSVAGLEFLPHSPASARASCLTVTLCSSAWPLEP